jgi:hypothetical protein
MFKFAAVQIATGVDKAQNLARAALLIREAAKAGARVGTCCPKLSKQHGHVGYCNARDLEQSLRKQLFQIVCWYR